MLAGPRRKQKISVDPRNKQWSEDANRFGQRLLKQMGWSHGKGLGLNEDGKTEHIKVSLKNDNRGLGCTQNVEDNWISHQDDFNDLLSNLVQEHNQGTSTNQPDQPRSIEEKSKKAKRRVHYKKFTRGKDLANRSVSDMNCILGRRSASGSNTPQSASAPSSDHENEEEEKGSHGVKTVVNSVSMQEYFAKKMSQMKGARLNGTVEGRGSPKVGSDEEGGSPTLGDGTDLDSSITGNVESESQRGDEGDDEKRKKRKKGKKRKRKLEDEDGETGGEKKNFRDEMEEDGARQDIDGEVETRMNGHIERQSVTENETLDATGDEDNSNLIRRDRKKEDGNVRDEDCEDDGDNMKRKKKKKKKKSKAEVDID